MTEPYYTWQTFETTLADEPIRWAGKPGLEAWNALRPSTRLLAEELTVIRPGQRVLDLRCNSGLCGALAARRGADVTLCDDNWIAIEAARRTLDLNRVSGQLIHGKPYKGSEPLQGFDVVLLDAPRGREWVWHLITLATQALKPGGQFLLAGANRGGIKGFIEDTRKILGPCEVARIKAGNRLALGKRAPAASDPPSAVSPICEATVRGHTVRFVTQPGVFSRGELDAGTRALVETMAIRPGESMLDLGCGSGIAGAVAAQMGAQVVCVDSSAAALETCRTTLKLNSVSGTVLASDCASAVRDGRFDVVATNPPFHQGLGVEYDVAQQFIRDAAHVLTQGGRLYLVANRFIQYERMMSNQFSQVTTAYEDNHFHVLKAVR